MKEFFNNHRPRIVLVGFAALTILLGLVLGNPLRGLLGFSVVSGYQSTVRASMTATQDTVPVSSLTLKDGTVLDMSVLGSVVFLTLEPGKSKEEIVACTGVTTSTLTFTGCTRGLAFSGTSTLSVANNRKTHNAGAIVTLSNVHYVYEELVDKDADENIGGIKRFISDILKLGDQTTTSDKILYADNGSASLPFVKYDESLAKWQFSDDGVTTINLATSSAAGLSPSSTKAIFITDSLIGVNASSTTGMTFDSSGRLYQAIDSTLQWVANVLSVNTSTLLSQLTSITSAVGKIPVASSVTSTLHGSWFGTSTPGALFYVGPDGYSTALGVGSAGQSLKVSSTSIPSWSPSPLLASYYQVSGTSNFTTEVGLATTTIAANTLKVGDRIEIPYKIIISDSGSGSNQTFNIKVGGSTAQASTVSSVDVSGESTHSGIFSLYVKNATTFIVYSVGVASASETNGASMSTVATNIANAINIIQTKNEITDSIALDCS
jgi:hypothetical protein